MSDARLLRWGPRLTAIGLVVALQGAALATSGGVYMLPPNQNGATAYSTRNGLNLELDSRWFDTGGYRPVRARLTSVGQATADRQIDIRVTFSDTGRTGDDDLVVSQSFTLPAGDDSVETVIRCPSLSTWTAMHWTVEVNGRLDADLSTDSRSKMMLSPIGRDSMFRLLRPSRLLDRDRVGLASARTLNQVGIGENRRLVADTMDCEPMSRWIDYTSAEIIVIDLPALRAMSGRPESEVAALRRWLIAGGVVWVERAGDSPESYAEIDDLLGVARWRMTSTDEKPSEVEQPSSPEPTEAVDGNSSAEPRDAEPTPRERKGGVTPVADAPGWGYLKIVPEQTSDENGAASLFGALAALTNPGTLDTRGWFAQRDAGFGQVIAFNKLPFDAPQQLQRSQSRQVFGEWRAFQWSNRHGFDPGAGSADFGNLLIPGVGMAPVNEFQVLITLFVLVIGPLNYWLLWRRQQLQLLVITTPLVALVATLGLAAYAAVSDGFGVKARAHSITLLDQSTGEAASWSRVSHYVATTPEEPPVIPADTVIYPIEPVWESAFADRDADLTLDWEADRQVLKTGWTPSRTPVQHLLVRSRKTDKRLEFAGAGDGLRVSNRFGVPLELLVVRNEEGDWMLTENLPAGEAAAMEPVDHLGAMQAFRTMAISRMPSFPLGAGRAVEDTLERFGGASAMRDIRRMQRGGSTALLSENASSKVLDALTGLDGGRSLDVPPRSYVAVTSQAVETPLGWDDIVEYDSMHIVVGRW